MACPLHLADVDMHSHSLRNPYDDSGIVIESFPPPIPQMPPVPQMPPSTRSKRSTKLTKRKSKSKSLGKSKRSSGARGLGYVLVLAMLGGAGYYGYSEVRSAKDEAKNAETQLQAVSARIARAESAAMAASADLMRSQKELALSAESLAEAEEAARTKEAAATELEGKLKSLLEDGQGEVLKGADGRLTLQLVDKVLFKSGEAELTERGRRVMARVGVALGEMHDKQIWVQGHTDNVPIQKGNTLFKSNWELSAIRALNVVHFLQDESGLDPKRLAAAAFGSHRPVSRRKKAKNRRIEIVLFPREVKLEQ